MSIILTTITQMSLTTVQMLFIKLSALISRYTALNGDLLAFYCFVVILETKVFWKYAVDCNGIR